MGLGKVPVEEKDPGPLPGVKYVYPGLSGSGFKPARAGLNPEPRTDQFRYINVKLIH